MRWTWKPPRPRFRTASLLILIALIAVGLASWKAYWAPERAWRRAIHRQDASRRLEAWGAATGGKIAGLGPKATSEEVAATLEDSDDRAVASAIVAYPLIEPDANLAASRLALRLAVDGQAGIRRLAASSLRTAVRPDGSGRDRAVPPLIAALDDPDPGVRRQAAMSLGEIGYRVGHSKDDSPEKALRGRLADGDSSVRLAAALALARGGGGEEAVPLLAGFLEGHRDQDCPVVDCSLAFEALMVLAVRSDQAASALIAGVYREARGPSGETLAALGAVVAGDHRAKTRVSALARGALKAPIVDLRLSASLTLARIDEGRDAIPGLVEALDRGTAGARGCADAILRRVALDEPEAIRAALAGPSVGEATRQALRSMVAGR